MPPLTKTILRRQAAYPRWHWAILDAVSGFPLASGAKDWRADARIAIKRARRKISAHRC